MNILIVGLGSIGQKHLDALKEIDANYNIYALRSNSSSTIVEGVTTVFSLDEINDKIDFVIISNPTSLHIETIRKVMGLNCPLFIEKPLSHKTEYIEDLITEIHSRNIRTYVACNLRFHPLIEFLKENKSLNTKRINEVNIYCGSNLKDWRKNTDFKNIYSALPEMGGGVHLDLIHELDYTYWIWGKPTKTFQVLSNKSSLDILSVDNACFIWSYPKFNVSIKLNYYRPTPKRNIEIVFEEDIWNVDLINNCITDINDDIVFEQKNYNVLETYKNQLSYFIRKINTNEIFINPIEEAFEILKLAVNE